jgi:hypothetical protein
MTFSQILDLWPSRQAVRRDLEGQGFSLSMMAVSRWDERDSIPPVYWPPMLKAAAERGLELKNEDFMAAVQAADARRNPERHDPQLSPAEAPA